MWHAMAAGFSFGVAFALALDAAYERRPFGFLVAAFSVAVGALTLLASLK